MSSIESWRRMMLKGLRDQGLQSRIRAQSMAAAMPGSSMIQSGALRSATEGIAGQEAVEAAGIGATADAMEAERRAGRVEALNQQNENRRANKRAAWLGLGEVALGAALPGIGKVAGGFLSKLFRRQPAAQPAAAAPAIAPASTFPRIPTATGIDTSPLAQFLLRRRRQQSQPLNYDVWR